MTTVYYTVYLLDILKDILYNTIVYLYINTLVYLKDILFNMPLSYIIQRRTFVILNHKKRRRSLKFTRNMYKEKIFSKRYKYSN